MGGLPDSGGFSAKPAPTGGLRLPAGKHTSILTEYQTIVKKKIKKTLFLKKPKFTTIVFGVGKFVQSISD